MEVFEVVLMWVGAIIVALCNWGSTKPDTAERQKANNWLLAAILGPLGLILVILCWLNDD